MRIRIARSDEHGRLAAWECSMPDGIAQMCFSELCEVALIYAIGGDEAMKKHFDGVMPTLEQLRELRPEWFAKET